MDKVTVPPLKGVYAEPWSLRRFLAMMSAFGPAAIVASVSIGAGETIVVVRLGAWSGYDLLWLILLSVLAKSIFVTYLLGRYTAISGEYIGHRLVHLPGPRGWLLITLIVLELSVAPLAWVAISKPCGDLVHHLFIASAGGVDAAEKFWENGISTFFIAVAMLFGIRLSFERLEKQQLAICGILVIGTMIGTLMVRPDFVGALLGTFGIYGLPDPPAWAPADAIKHPLLTLATAFGYVGGGVFTYLAYSNWVGLHRWGLTGHDDIDRIREHASASKTIDYLPEDDEQVSRLRQLVSPLRWDVCLGAIVLFLVSAAFLISGAVVLMPLQTRFEGWSLLTNQAHVWANIHPTLVWIYYVCIIAALWGTLQALPEMYARVVQGFTSAVWPDRTWNFDSLKRYICLYMFAVATTIIWLDIPFDTLIQIAGFILANLAIALLMPAAIYLNFMLPPRYRTRPAVLIGALLSAVVLFIFACVSGWGLSLKLFG